MRTRDKQFSSDAEDCYVMIAGTQVSRLDYVRINNSIQGVYRQSMRRYINGDMIYSYLFDVRNKGLVWMDSNEIKSVVKEQRAKWKCMGDELRNWKPPWGNGAGQ